MEDFQAYLWQAWLGLAIVLGVAELFSLDLVLIMLAAGALAGMGVAALDGPVLLQALAAAGTSVAMLGVVRPNLARRLHGGPELLTGHGKLLGRQGTVTETVTALSPGRVNIGGDVWSAEPYDESLTIEAGVTVEVLEIRGATAYVHPMPMLEN
jgi:membrane protein implicated in regulation of membrane protease activity